jgi:iron complex transport system permease protein
MIMENCAKKKRLLVMAAVFFVLTVALVYVNITTGSVKNAGWDIIYEIRLPRIAESVILGGALALSGFLLQTFFGNPIAGPYVLGISHGARLSVALVSIILLEKRHTEISSGFMITAAFIGSVAVMGFILAASKSVRNPSTLIICGVMAGYICSAVTDFVSAFADDASIVSLHNWSKGSFSGASWHDVSAAAVITFTAAFLAFSLSKPLSAYQMGEHYARSVGVNIKFLRFAIVILSSVLCAAVTAFAGPVSFVGIAVPHLVKSFLKTSKPILVIPMCFWFGALFCMGCDLIARTIFAPAELSVNSVTAAAGAPVVIRIILKRKDRE